MDRLHNHRESGGLRLVLCDDHVMLLEGLASALTAHGHVVVGTTPSPHLLPHLVECTHPDVCILDVRFPDGDGVAAAAQVARVSPHTDVVLLSVALSPDVVRRALEAGVKGFVRKDVTIDGILRALDRLADDHVSIDRDLLQSAMAGPARHQGDGVEPLEQLTAREHEVLDLLVAGDDTVAIAARLNVATSTVRTHVQCVFSKLGVHSRLQAVAYATTHSDQRRRRRRR